MCQALGNAKVGQMGLLFFLVEETDTGKGKVLWEQWLRGCGGTGGAGRAAELRTWPWGPCCLALNRGLLSWELHGLGQLLKPSVPRFVHLWDGDNFISLAYRDF